MKRTLVLLRHAKSAYPIGVHDLDRPLNRRGRESASESGHWIASHVGSIDRALVSVARRTQETWRLVSGGGASAADVIVEPQMYGASWWEILDLVREQPVTASTVLLVGHNPGTEDLADELISGGDAAAKASLRAKFPTAAIAVLSCDLEWNEWGSDCAHLDAFHKPHHVPGY